MLEGLDTWKKVLILCQSKVSTDVGKIAIVSFRRPHEYQAIAQASKHVDSFIWNLSERRRMFKQDSRAVSQFLAVCNILRVANLNGTGTKANAL